MYTPFKVHDMSLIPAGGAPLGPRAPIGLELPVPGRPPDQATVRPWRSRALSRTVGSAGAGKGSALQLETWPNRRPALQSSRAWMMSSWERPTKFQHITRSSSNGSPPSRATRASPGASTVSSDRPGARCSSDPDVTVTSPTSTAPDIVRTPYSNVGSRGSRCEPGPGSTISTATSGVWTPAGDFAELVSPGEDGEG